jgi:hypothetical protein
MTHHDVITLGIASRCSLTGSSITSSQSDLAAGTALMTHLSNSSASTEDLRKRKQTKNQYAAVVEIFNKPDMKGSKEAMEMLYKANLVPQGDAAALARFFRYTPGLSRANVGEFIGKRDDFHIAVLTEYVKLFDCKGMTFDSALRAFLESFRIPGEAQIISRILEIWAAHYYNSNPGPFADSGKAEREREREKESGKERYRERERERGEERRGENEGREKRATDTYTRRARKARGTDSETRREEKTGRVEQSCKRIRGRT